MEQRLQLQQKMSQRLIMTPQMQQSIQLLQLSTLELTELVQQEMAENPMLEEEEFTDSMDRSMDMEVPDMPREEDTDTPVSDLIETGRIELDENWADYFADSSDIGQVISGTGNGTYEDEEEMNLQMAYTESLKDHLIWQLGVSTQNEQEYKIGEYLIDQLDDDGYLQTSVQEIAGILDESPDVVEHVLQVIQGFDPPGIAARNLTECLEIQLRHYEMDDSDILEVVRHHLEDLERHRFREIARALGVSDQHVQEIADIISTLDPRPGRQYQQTNIEYITPDVFVERVDGEWQVRVNDDGSPPLRISRKYREMLQHSDQITNEEYDFIKKKFQSAIWRSVISNNADVPCTALPWQSWNIRQDS